MGTKIGLLSSNKPAVLYSSQKSAEEIEKELSRYSEQDLYETLLMTEYLLLKARRKEAANEIWIQRIERQLSTIKLILPEPKRSELMKRMNFSTSVDANRHAQMLLFRWFR